MQQADAPDCFLQRLLKDKDKFGLDDEHIIHVCGTTVSRIIVESSLYRLALALFSSPHHPKPQHQRSSLPS